MTAWPSPTPCKCGSAMAWARTDAGKRIPLDATANGDPIPYPDDGKAGRIQETWRTLITVTDTAPLAEPGATVERVDECQVTVLDAGQAADPELPVWRSHFATCPAAKAHRRGR